MVKLTIEGEVKEYEAGVRYEEVAREYQERYGGRIALVIENGKIKELIKKATKDAEVSFAFLDDSLGHKTYVRTATMLLVKAVRDVVGMEEAAGLQVEFAIGHGYYCAPKGNWKVDARMVENVKRRMWELTAADLPIRKKAYPAGEAVELFGAQGMQDKVKLFKYRRGSYINVYELDGYYDYYYGYMLPSTGYVKWFDLQLYEDGFLLVLPPQENPTGIEPFEPRPKLFAALKRSAEWGESMGLDTVGDLNNAICGGNDLAEMILVQEALQERRIAEIAQEIVNRGGIRFVMIAGPSSSGKTTFSHRLSIQLQTHGLHPHPIAVDDYFCDREKTPRHPDGSFNFECLEAIDVKQFNEDMCALLAGEEVELPSFNFKTGKREYRGNRKKLGRGDVLVIEGIHGLNDKMSYALPGESKFKIYISALTSLNVDGHNRIPTTDGRLIRRMVRDARTRGATAQHTISMWASVRRGEEENIFPFQESADATFNSALLYELAVLKPYAEPLLYGIGKGEPEYYEAKRLLKFLEYFLSISSEPLPNNSILREFVGGSCFRV